MSPKPAQGGHWVYTKPILSVYDLFVIRFCYRILWKCHSGNILTLYDSHVSTNHLDVGVGTGFFLDHCHFPSDRPRLALLDSKPRCLESAAQRLRRYNPEVYQADVLEPIHFQSSPFDSVSLSCVLHCLLGTIQSKAIVFEHLKSLMNPGGILFGATIPHKGIKHGLLARRLMDVYNSMGAFSNADDDLDGLRHVLAQHFTNSSVKVVGSVALFWGRI